MAAQSGETLEFTLESVVRGHHIYKAVWVPFEGETLAINKSLENRYDRYAVDVVNNGETVGHVPKELSKKVWHYLNHGGQAVCEITGHRRKGKGLEVPCLYKFSGPKTLVNKMKKLTAKYEC